MSLLSNDLERDFDLSCARLDKEMKSFAAKENAFNAKIIELANKRLIPQATAETKRFCFEISQQIPIYKMSARSWMNKTSQLNMILRGDKTNIEQRQRHIKTLEILADASKAAVIGTIAFRDSSKELSVADVHIDLKVISLKLAEILDELVDLFSAVQSACANSLRDF